MSQEIDRLYGTRVFIEHVINRELTEWEKEHLKERFNDFWQGLINNPIEEPEQVVYSTGVVIAKARQNGINNAIKNLIEDFHPLGVEVKPVSLTTPRRCDCLKCRMGKSDQCTTYSPRKRGRK